MQRTLNVPRRSGTSVNGWYVVGLAASVWMHVGAYRWAGHVPLEGFSKEPVASLVPPRFVVKQVAFDPKTLQDAPEPPKPAEKAPVAPEKLVFNEGKPKVADVDLQVKPVEKQKLPEEKVEPRMENVRVAPLKTSGPSSLDSELRSVAGGLLQAGPSSRAQPVLAMAAQAGVDGASEKAGGGRDMMFSGRISLDDALDRMGKVPTRDSPVAIPGNALFEYAKAELGSEALPVLQKISDLRRRFPDYIMVIIGHTDSKGTEEYNLGLSQRRADAVKEWLVKHHKMDPSKIETAGRGSAELIVPPGSVDDEAPNRRVEVILRPVLQPGKDLKR